MNPLRLDDLCADVSAIFGLDEADALGVGFPATMGGVEVELVCAGWAQDRVQVLLTLGEMAKGKREACFMTALALQGHEMLANWAHFVLDAVNDRLLWCVSLALGADADPASVADLIRQLVEEVHAWRTGAFAGLLGEARASNALAS